MESSLLVPEEHVLSTLERDGSRRWMYPRLANGYFWHIRRIVGYALIILFVSLPHIKIAGKPAILLDIAHRRFTLFGFTFLPTDTLLLALLMMTIFLTIFLLTAILGRVWCGWACPQTVYMEFVFRPIERFFDGTKGVGGRPPERTAGMRRTLKYIVYFILSVFLAHTFLAYFVGVERLSRWIQQSPFEHPIPFFIMAGTTVAMMFDFCFFREQLCLIACPYGRFQSVLLDRQSLIVSYDYKRGEPRGHLTKSLPVLSNEKQGDCVDCGACVRTCPTGIDIRKGLQMECIHCTQCIDACDAIMNRLHRPMGLIRYSTQNAIDGRQKSWLRPRLFVYPVLLTVVISAFVITLVNKKSFDVTVLRNFGMPFILAANDEVQNSMRIKLVNRIEKPLAFQLRVADRKDVMLDIKDTQIEVSGGAMVTQPVLITAPAKDFVNGEYDIKLSIQSSDGEERTVSCRLLGPSRPNP